MIRVTVELIPYGFGKPEILGTLEIINDGVQSRETGGQLGTYTADFFSKNGRRLTKRSADITGWRRKANPVWGLVKRCLEEGGY